MFAKAKSMILVPIAIIIVALDLQQFIGWVAPFWVYIDISLDSIIIKLQCSIFCIRININRVPLCVIVSILSLKLHVFIVDILLVGLI